MFNRKYWQNPAAKPPRCLHSKITLTIDLSPLRPGERTPFEQAMRTIFPRGWTRRDARIVAIQAIKAVSEAIVKDREATFPLEVEMLHGPMRRSTVRLADIINVNFRTDGEAA